MSRIAHDMLLNDNFSATDLAGSLMTMNGMKLLQHVAENGGIELTKSGFFNRKYVVWAAEEFQWPNYQPTQIYRLNKVLNEQDFPPLSVMHELMLLGLLIRHRKGRAILTSAGKTMLGNFGQLQALLFETYFTQYDFRADARFPSYIEHNDYRHFLGVVANRVGEWVTLVDFAHWCLPVPLIPSTRGRPEFEASLYMRSNFVRPLCWLGLMEEDVAPRMTPLEQRRIRNSSAVNIIRLLALTGARRNEIAGLRWDEVDLNKGYLRLKDSKTGAKVIPLGAAPVDILSGLSPIKNSPYVFPATSGKSHFQGVKRVWQAVRTEAGFPQLRLHDLRHSFASIGLAAGDRLSLIGALLGHSNARTTERYAHLTDDPTKNAAHRISGQIAKALATDTTTVISLSKQTRNEFIS